jgi:hypothetical protein
MRLLAVAGGVAFLILALSATWQFGGPIAPGTLRQGADESSDRQPPPQGLQGLRLTEGDHSQADCFWVYDSGARQLTRRNFSRTANVSSRLTGTVQC